MKLWEYVQQQAAAKSVVAAALMIAMCLLMPQAVRAQEVLGVQQSTPQIRTVGCRVTQDDGKTFVDRSVDNCQQYYASHHACHDVGPTRPAVCKYQDMFKAVNWGHEDMIINTHRGIWGMTLLPLDQRVPAHGGDFAVDLYGPPENSYAGVNAAVEAGFHTVEYDLFLMRDADGSNPTVIVNHYADLRGFTNYSGKQVIPLEGTTGGQGFMVSQSWKTMQSLDPDQWTDGTGPVLRMRDETVADPSPENRLMTVKHFLSLIHAEHPEVVIVFDLKWAKQLNLFMQKKNDGVVTRSSWCIGFCNTFKDKNKTNQEVYKLIDLTLKAATTTETLPNIIFKIPQVLGGPVQLLSGLQEADPTFAVSTFVQVQWAPQPLVGADSEGANKDAVLAYIHDWMSDSPLEVSFWDTTIYSSTSWMGHEFSVDNVTYRDLMGYLQQETGRRASIWAPDPGGPAGRHGNYAMTSMNYGNDSNDVRGDLLYNLGYSYSRNAIISTDRPDVALRIRNYLDQRDCAVYGFCRPK